MSGAIDEGQRWGEAAVAVARRLGDPARLMQPLLVLSEYPRFSGEPARALALKAEALDMARAAGHRELALIQDDMASIHAGLGDYRRRIACWPSRSPSTIGRPTATRSTAPTPS